MALPNGIVDRLSRHRHIDDGIALAYDLVGGD